MITVSDLTVSFAGTPVVSSVSFEVAAGECLAIVGQSGSGKSVTARALLGLSGGVVHASALRFDDVDLLRASPRRLRQLRGTAIGFVSQGALVALDPLRRVGQEVGDPLRLHTSLSPAARGEQVVSLLSSVGIPDPAVRASQRADELSGGLRQRAVIASAVALQPRLLIADEPTTALDSTVAAGILSLLEELRASGTGILLISHDLATVARLASRIAVMREGRIVETGATADVLTAPQHPYTRELIAAVPTGVPRGIRLAPAAAAAAVPTPTTPAAPANFRNSGDGRDTPAHRSRLADAPLQTPEFRNLRREKAVPQPAAEAALDADVSDPIASPIAPPTFGNSGVATARVFDPASKDSSSGVIPEFPKGAGTGGRTVVEAVALRKTFGSRVAVDDVGFTLERGRTLGIVGESGSGKTTVARLVLALEKPDAGSLTLFGQPWTGRDRRANRIGAIYQDALSSFDPRWTVARILGPDTDELLHLVGLPSELAQRRPRFLSGGQQQRVAIARAIAPRPDLLVCDEPVSSLDVSAQARILDLLDDLQQQLGLSYLFISHDLGVIRHVSDDVLVMRDGRVLERGATEAVFADPQHNYTRALIAAAPTLSTT